MPYDPRGTGLFPEPTWWNGSPDWRRDGLNDPEFYCSSCEDMGCPECCEPQPIEMDDLDEMCGILAGNDPPR
jgi:hypothetical protein